LIQNGGIPQETSVHQEFDPKLAAGRGACSTCTRTHHQGMPESVWESCNALRGKTTLVLQSLLHIHESIVDAEAMQGYEGLPLQVEKIYWEVWGVLARNPGLTTSDEVLEVWIDEYASPDFHA